jgi:hypothetical protein
MVLDPHQATFRSVNLPKPDCAARPSDCEDIDVINTLDGFNLQPRLAIPFDGAGALFEVPIVPPLPEELNFIP